MLPFPTSDTVLYTLHSEANLMGKVIKNLLDVGNPSPRVNSGVKADIKALATPLGIDH